MMRAGSVVRRSARYALAAAAVCTLLAAWSCAGSPPPPPDVTGAVDFATILRLSRAYRTMRHDTTEQAYAALGPGYDSLTIVDLPATENRYMIGTVKGQKRQEIWIRGTANFRNALYDVQYRKHWNGFLGCNIHAGFEKMALAVYSDILPRLDPAADLVIFGHSLGAAEAVILAMIVWKDGFRVAQVYASGQPRVTDAAGETTFAALPVLRIVNEGDPVPYLPPRDVPSAKDPYVHLGDAVILLDGTAYCRIGEDRGNEEMAKGFWQLLAADETFTPVKEHLIDAYIARLEAKVNTTVPVPYADRSSYVTTEKGK
jgi:hypothetical protein